MDTESTKFLFKTITFSPIFFLQWLSFETVNRAVKSPASEKEQFKKSLPIFLKFNTSN